MPKINLTAFERIAQRIHLDENGCWIWEGAKASGYGVIGINQKPKLTHILTYEAVVGPVPKGLELDHLCRNPACCNPAHLEAVTHSENCLRGTAGQTWAKIQRSKTHCPKGHEYSQSNTRICGNRRICITCKRTRNRNRERVKALQKRWMRAATDAINRKYPLLTGF